MRGKINTYVVFGWIWLGLMCRFVSAEVVYRLDIEATWSPTTHPGAFPGGAHFTRIVGGTHNDLVTFWEPGEMATPGLESVAEVGGTSLFSNEIQTAIANGTAASAIAAPRLSGLPNSTSSSFSISESHPLVTLASMVAPSPDWFVGVTGLTLRENDAWLGRVTIDLDAYDAGTEEGEIFSLSNPATTPQDVIRRITTGPLASLPPVGTITLTIQPNELAGDFNLDGVVNGDDALFWQAGLRNFPDGSATVIDGDANADGFVNGSDFLLWQQNLGQSLSGTVAAVSVPETETFVLLILGWILAANCPVERATFFRD